MAEVKRVRDRIKAGIKTHLVDSTALSIVSNPVFSAFETMVAGMSNENSIHARMVGTGLTYAGMGRLFTKGMDLSRKLFKIKSETPERIKQLHDAAYATAYNIVISPAFYYVAGVRDFKQIAIGTAAAAGLALVAGGPMGYAVDAYRDLTCIKESERLPSIIKNQGRTTKAGLAGLLAAASIGAMALIYEANNRYMPPITPSQQAAIQNK